jgi:hypothetical protein
VPDLILFASFSYKQQKRKNMDGTGTVPTVMAANTNIVFLQVIS